VELDLVERRRLAGLGDHALEVCGLEVGHPDRADQTLVAQLDESLPSLYVAVVGRHRPMDQIEIHVVDLEPLEARVEGPSRLLVPMIVVEALRRDEHLAPIEAGSANCLTDGCLVAICRGGVDVAIADFECLCHGLRGLGGRDLEDAEAELRDLRAAAQRDLGDLTR